jgi:peptidylprolyl isomerase
MNRRFVPWIAATLALAVTGAARAGAWRAPDPASTLVIDTSKGRIVVEMHPELAPQAVARIILLSRERVYDGLLFHRVISHFVDQTGNPNNHDGGVSAHPDLAPEFFAPISRAALGTAGAEGTDGISGWLGALPVAALPQPGKPGMLRAWGAYCAGTAGMGRQASPGSANSEIFFMRDASRRLDHDYTVWGQVILGLDVVRAIEIGEPPAHPDRMLSVRLMADMPAASRPRLEVMQADSPAFRAGLATVRAAKGADFSICDVPVPTRVLP